MAKRALLLAVLVASMAVGFGGCSLFQPNVVIDWVNFVRFGGITYLASFDTGRELQLADLGTRFATVRFRLDAFGGAGHIARMAARLKVIARVGEPD